MKYVSTRGEAPILAFDDVLLTGLARDGGLYVPENWPQVSTDELTEFAGLSYTDLAFRVIQPFVGGAIAWFVLWRPICSCGGPRKCSQRGM